MKGKSRDWKFVAEKQCGLLQSVESSKSARRVSGLTDGKLMRGDADTADIFTEVSRGVDKWLWMVEAHLQE